MADNFTANPGSGGSVFASDDISSVQYPRVKPSWGADGSAVDTSVTAPLPIQVVGQAAGGASIYRKIGAASTNAANIKGSAGTVYGITATNVNAAAVFLKLYNKATSPTVGTDTPVMTMLIPGATTGGGFVFSVPQGIAFATGISVAITGAVGDADTTAVSANEQLIHILYV